MGLGPRMIDAFRELTFWAFCLVVIIMASSGLFVAADIAVDWLKSWRQK